MVVPLELYLFDVLYITKRSSLWDSFGPYLYCYQKIVPLGLDYFAVFFVTMWSSRWDWISVVYKYVISVVSLDISKIYN